MTPVALGLEINVVAPNRPSWRLSVAVWPAAGTLP